MKCDGVLFLTVFTLLCAASLGYNNGYGMKPFLGWQSWCAVGKCGTDLCHDQQIRDTAKALVDTGMKDLTTLYDSIMVHVDGAGRPQGLTVSVGADKKCGADLKPRSLQKFKTKVSIKRAEGGPTPFLDKFREELQKRVPGREGEAPQGFFSKYWMYIVPAYLFITLMGNGGGGDAKGGAAASA